MPERLIKLYQAEWCSYCRRVRMKLAELGVPYITVNVPDEKPMREDLFNISGQRGIPTLVDGDVVIADDDDAIIAYLEGRFAKVPAAGSFNEICTD
ncbi:glutaredoxin family protein [Candidatus Manganitrophus noduliformans]|uniref:Glutaredoxin n=1 Tax=Candidatus Manganitrophus noduliformans TaxID=2606439 RepID=A0A7X6IAD9_9BACT|nr:glutathione S-transferase N-terminal domain-containing protein [Candidatus Manganitrophus noduliformans]NKE70284.1 glutaredoxin [Candidatus Manganitrophus noduliformans]